MYNDYPTVFESNVNQNFIYYIIILIMILAAMIFTFISLSKIFKKANRSVISAWIPIYNILTLLEIVNLPKWYIVMLCIPVVNILFFWKIVLELSSSFKRNKKFAIGLLILPFIYYPILAFSSSEYLGINLIAQEGTTTVTNIPDIDNKEDMNLTIHEEQDTASRNINISIGGGVYQKDYTKNLLQADDKQQIKAKPNLIDSKVRDTSNNSFIKVVPEEVEEVKKAETAAFEMPSMLNPIQKPSIDSQTEENTINKVEEGIEEEKIVESNPNSEFIFCPKCKAKLRRGTNVCFLCGNRIQ